MAIKISFDNLNNPEMPTIILARRSGKLLGKLVVFDYDLSVSDTLVSPSEMSFTIHKYTDGEKQPLWNEITDFKLVYCPEWKMWYEITVELSETNKITKVVTCTQLQHAELSQTKLYNIEINTEDDIARDDYVKPTILYDDSNHSSSLLHRITEKVPHYKIIHVDDTIANIQRVFSFDETSILDAFKEIEKEINCLFVFSEELVEEQVIPRTISVYDLESNCKDCGYRGEFTQQCPDCGSKNIDEGYGEDTSIFIDSDDIANEIVLTENCDEIKNCFKLEAGDELMTATVRNCNPNGTDYIWYISDKLKAEMSEELRTKINEYDVIYLNYQKNYVASLSNEKVLAYNELVNKYRVYKSDLETIITPLRGYAALMNAYYSTIDFSNYLNFTLMPNVEISETSAAIEVVKLTNDKLSPVSLSSIDNMSLSTANNAVLSMAKVLVDSRYKIEIISSSLNNSTKVWTGNFKITNYSDEEDTANSNILTVVINEDYASFTKQRIDELLSKENTDGFSVTDLFNKNESDFKNELKKYCLSSLESFLNICQGCIDVLIKNGIGDKNLWLNQTFNLYEDIYIPYYNKLIAIEDEIYIRENEIAVIDGIYDNNGELKTSGLQHEIETIKQTIQEDLNFENYLETDLWMEFCSFRREDKYSNSNYISDGLNNAELFKKAQEFIEVANTEIFKSSELQHSITSDLNNLLAYKDFKGIVAKFCVGNWLRIKIDDAIYKLRLVKFDISYGSLGKLIVEFSDITKVNSTIASVQDILNKSSSIASSYDSVQRQAQQGEKSNSTINKWVENGLDTTNMKIVSGAENQTQSWDSHGMLFRQYDEISDVYDDIQLKIINSTLVITDDNWKTVKTAVGAYYYFHPETNKLTRTYGINSETLVGKLILGEQLGIYNSSGNLTFDDNGFVIKNDNNTFIVNPNSEKLLNITNGSEDIMYLDNSGSLHISGTINAGDGSKIGLLTIDDDGNMSNSGITICAKETSSYIDMGYSYISEVVKTNLSSEGFRLKLANYGGDVAHFKQFKYEDSNGNELGITTQLVLGNFTYDEGIDHGIILNGELGSIYCNGVSQTSDENIKNKFVWQDDYDKAFMELNPILFTWKKNIDKKQHLGLGARETKSILEKYNLNNSGIVVYDKDKDLYSIAYSELHALEINAIKKNRNLIEEIQKQIIKLMKEMSKNGQ